MRIPRRIQMLTSMSGAEIDLPHGAFLDVGPATILPQRQINAELAREWHAKEVATVTDWEEEKGQAQAPVAAKNFEPRRHENGRRS